MTTTAHLPRRPGPDMAALASRYRGCVLGGAVGDALGAPVEFMSLAEIQSRHGAEGIRDFAPAFGRVGSITDDTQMTLFTAEGLLRAWVRFALRGIGPAFDSVTANAYLRWLRTQGGRTHKHAVELRSEVTSQQTGKTRRHRGADQQRRRMCTCDVIKINERSNVAHVVAHRHH